LVFVEMDRVKSLQDEGIIRHAGLSNVSVEDIEAASEVFKVATVQNRYNLVAGKTCCPLFPLAAGSLAKSGAAPSQIALAWVLKRSPIMLPIPGT
jgi:pyridoxine 4-dehydrogenase